MVLLRSSDRSGFVGDVCTAVAYLRKSMEFQWLFLYDALCVIECPHPTPRRYARDYSRSFFEIPVELIGKLYAANVRMCLEYLYRRAHLQSS
mmetsp:Transcript_14276/g.21991  ORF Transcript_14276/g.21991 Transcript_14276/m.21991 type:complete len:92 (+) Transcript_14276:1514-1789(+)